MFDSTDVTLIHYTIDYLYFISVFLLDKLPLVFINIFSFSDFDVFINYQTY